MSCQLAKVWLSFNIYGLVERLCHKKEIHSHAARQVNHLLPHIQSSAKRSFITRRLLAGRLLHIQMRRIEKPFGRCPCRPFLLGCLPTTNLFKGKRQIYICWTTFECQLVHIVMAMCRNERCRFLIHATKIIQKFDSVSKKGRYSLFRA